MSGPVIVDARRTPIGTRGRGLAGVTAPFLAAPVLVALAAELADPPDEVVLGNCMGPGGDVARVAVLAAGLPESVPALTVDRQCASGLAAIEIGAALARTGRTVLAGGVESASTAPWRLWPPATPEDAPTRYERAPFAPTAEQDPDMGLAADLLAEEHGVDRARQDAYAAASHRRAWAAAQAGLLDEEIVPVAGMTRDERLRDGMTAERLARFPAAFREGGTVTAANSCGINDGAAVVTIAPGGGPGLRVVATASAGVDPRRPGIGLVPAVRQALAAAELDVADLDVVEVNEAFAGQVLACYDELGLDPGLACAQGGALALGHPWGASGAVLVVRLFSQMIRQGRGRFGLAAIAAGGGQGTAIVVEACR